MSLNAHDASAGVFVRGLTNLKAQLTKAEAYVAASDGNAATVLSAQLGDERSLAELHQLIDATIAYLREIPTADLEAGPERTIVIEHRHGTTTSSGSQFMLAYAIPHFYYHVTTAYSIMRSQGVPLTMGDFLGNWGSA